MKAIAAKFLDFGNQLEAVNQQEKSMEAEGLGLERSKEMIESGTDLQF